MEIFRSSQEICKSIHILKSSRTLKNSASTCTCSIFKNSSELNPEAGGEPAGPIFEKKNQQRRRTAQKLIRSLQDHLH
jgi:hypothetical protein